MICRRHRRVTRKHGCLSPNGSRSGTRTRPSDSQDEQDAGHTGMETAGTNLFFTLLLRILGAVNTSCCTLSGHLVEGLKATRFSRLCHPFYRNQHEDGTWQRLLGASVHEDQPGRPSNARSAVRWKKKKRKNRLMHTCAAFSDFLSF